MTGKNIGSGTFLFSPLLYPRARFFHLPVCGTLKLSKSVHRAKSGRKKRGTCMLHSPSHPISSHRLSSRFVSFCLIRSRRYRAIVSILTRDERGQANKAGLCLCLPFPTLGHQLLFLPSRLSSGFSGSGRRENKQGEKPSSRWP